MTDFLAEIDELSATGQEDFLASIDRYAKPTLGEHAQTAAASFVGALAEFPASILDNVAIAADLVNTMAKGAPVEAEGKLARDFAQAIRSLVSEAVPRSPKTQGEFFSDILPGALGSGAGFIAGGVATRGLKASAALTSAALGASIEAPAMYYEAEAAGKEGWEKWAAYAGGVGIGATEAIGIGRALDRADKATGGLFRRALIEGLEEMGQETVQGTMSNALAMALYDEDRELFDRVFTEGAPAGFLTGMILGGGVHMATRLAERGAVPRETVEEGAPLVPPEEGAEVPAGAPLIPPEEPGLTQVSEAAPEPAKEQAEIPELGQPAPPPSQLETLLSTPRKRTPVEGAAVPSAASVAEQAPLIARFEEANRQADPEIPEGALRVVTPQEGADADLVEVGRRMGLDVQFVDAGRELPLSGVFRDDTVILDANAPSDLRKRQLLTHEALHALKARLGGEWARLRERIQKLDPEGLAAAERLYAADWEKAMGSQLSAELLEEEGVSTYGETLSPYMQLALESPERLTRIATQDRTLFEAILDALAAVVNAFRPGTLKTSLQRHIDALQADVRQMGGEPLAKPLEAVRLARETNEAFLAMAEQRAPGTVAEGERFAPAPPTSSPEFKKWFGKSKVVDERGAPLVVFHGTAEQFSVFDAKRAGKANPFDPGLIGPAFYFTASGEQAGLFGGGAAFRAKAPEAAGGFGAGATVMPVYLSIQKPYYIQDGQLPDGRTLSELYPRGIEASIGSSLQREIKKAGHDGVIFRSDSDELQFVVFDPAQIKSAIGNRGTFSAADPDIRFAVEPTEAELDRVIELAAQAEKEGEGTAIGRPDLANISENAKVRALMRAVDQLRNEAGRPERVPNAVPRAVAMLKLEQDRPAVQSALLRKIESGETLESWETVAAKMLTADMAQTAISNESPEAYIDAVKLAWLWRESGTDQARAFQLRRDPLMTRRQFGREQLGEILSTPSKPVRRKLKRMREKVLDEATPEPRRKLLKQRIDKTLLEEGKKVAKAKKRLQGNGFDPEAITSEDMHDPVASGRIARVVSTSKSSLADWFNEFRISMMTSALTTHAANISGNTANQFMEQVVQRLAESVVNTVVRDKNSAQWKENVIFARNILPAFLQAGRNMTKAWRTEQPVFEADIKGRGVDGPQQGSKWLDIQHRGPAIPGRLGRVIRAPSLTTLLAMDEFSKTFVGITEAHALAHRAAKAEGLRGEALERRARDILMDTKHPIWEKAILRARKVTFQDENGKVLDGVLRFREWLNEISGGFPTGYILLPFVKTPFKIFATGIRRSPLQLARTMGRAAGLPFDKGAWAGDKSAMVQDLADSIIALGLTYAVLALVWDEDEDGLPVITGSSSPKRSERAAQYRTAPPQSIRIGGRYYSYSRIEPLAVTLATTVDMANAYTDALLAGHDAAAAEAGQRLFTSLIDQTKDKTFLRTIGDINDALSNRDEKRGNVARLLRDTLVTPMIPNIIRSTARASDDFIRTRTDRPQEDKGVWTAIFGPGLRYQALPAPMNAPPVRHDLWGRPIPRRGPGWGPGTDFLFRVMSPVQIGPSTNEISKLDMLLLNYNNRIDAGEIEADRFYPATPNYWYTVKGETKYFSDEEYEQLVEESGRKASESLLRKNLNWEKPTEEDIEKIRSALRRFRASVKRKILRAKQ